MAKIDSWTTVIAASNERYVEQLKLTVPTWRKHRPEIWQHPLCVIYGWGSLTTSTFDFLEHPDVHFAGWPEGDSFYLSDREMWLSAFVFVPSIHVDTRWWLKLDSDVVALGPADWIPEEPAIDVVGIWRPWGYTKPAWQVAAFNDWADAQKLEGLPIDVEYDPTKKTAKHKRMISKQSWTLTTFSRAAAKLLPIGRLPIASQDGYYSMLADRLKRKWVSYNAKRMSWADSCRMRKLKELSQIAMAYKEDE